MFLLMQVLIILHAHSTRAASTSAANAATSLSIDPLLKQQDGPMRIRLGNSMDKPITRNVNYGEHVVFDNSQAK